MPSQRPAHAAPAVLALCISAAVAVPALPAPAGAQAPVGEPAWVVGVTLPWAFLPSPMTTRCGDPGETAELRGIEAHVTRGLRAGLELTARVSSLGESLEPRCFDPSVPGQQGTFLVRRYPGEVDANRLLATELGLGWAPPGFHFLRAVVAGGWHPGTAAPYFGAALGVRLPGERLRFMGEVGTRFMSELFTEFEEEYDQGVLVRADPVGEGREWSSGMVARLGLEVPIR